MDSEDIWGRVCGELAVTLSEPTMQSWIGPCFIAGISKINEDRLLIELATPTAYHCKTIDERYYGQIKKALEKQTSKVCEVALLVKSKNEDEVVLSRKRESEGRQNSQELFETKKEISNDSVGLNLKYTFDSYVVGTSNDLAYAAARAVVDNPGGRHNPLFIWGGVGVGKTHLMQAVGHGLVAKGMRKVTYVSGEQFTNDLVRSFRDKTTDMFKKKYRQIGALLLDDVQFFAGKETMQEEFFHTFNELYMKGVQIVLTSDRKPQEIPQVEQRLVSRFLGGLTVDIGMPDHQMRAAILRQKSTEMAIEIDDWAIDLIAGNVVTNSRELEGVMQRLATLAKSEGKRVDAQMIERVVGIKKSEDRKSVRPVVVITTVAKQFNFRNKDLTGECRKADMVKARHIAMYLLNQDLKLTLMQIGGMLGGRDHTTVMHGIDKIKKTFDINQKVREEVMSIRRELYG